MKEFLNEAIIWRYLRHPNILPFFGINKTAFPGETCFVSPFIAHGNLTDFLKENPDQDRLPLVSSHDANLCYKRWHQSPKLSQIAKGLHYLHSTHICHGDVKAVSCFDIKYMLTSFWNSQANVLIDENYRCYLADFGIAALISTKTATVGFATATRSTKGTMRWMAPELFDFTKLNTDSSGIKSAPRDIYAFACTMLEVRSISLSSIVSSERLKRLLPENLHFQRWMMLLLCLQ
jgi:serine/threonine protein kinase